MVDEKEFLVLRYSLVEEVQDAIDIKPLPAQKGDAIIDAIYNESIFKKNDVSYSFIGFRQLANNIHEGKLAKLREAHLGKLVDNDVVDSAEEDWVPLILVFETSSQYVLASKNWKFGTVQQVQNAIEAGLNSSIAKIYNHQVFVRGVLEQDAFWRIVDNSKKIYKIRLKMVSPNILETDQIARDAIEALKALFNQDETVIELKNDSGDLNAPLFLASYVTYIEEGEGNWKLTVDGPQRGKKIYSSNDVIETVEIAVTGGEEANTGDLYVAAKAQHIDPSNLEDIFSSLRRRREGT